MIIFQFLPSRNGCINWYLLQLVEPQTCLVTCIWYSASTRMLPSGEPQPITSGSRAFPSSGLTRWPPLKFTTSVDLFVSCWKMLLFSFLLLPLLRYCHGHCRCCDGLLSFCCWQWFNSNSFRVTHHTTPCRCHQYCRSPCRHGFHRLRWCGIFFPPAGLPFYTQ